MPAWRCWCPRRRRSPRPSRFAVDFRPSGHLGSGMMSDMATTAGPARGLAHRSLLDGAVPDIERLIEFHAKETGEGRGRRRPDIQVVSRAAVVLTCASW